MQDLGWTAVLESSRVTEPLCASSFCRPYASKSERRQYNKGQQVFSASPRWQQHVLSCLRGVGAAEGPHGGSTKDNITAPGSR